jgi:CDGSH-type Zn-finger protein
VNVIAVRSGGPYYCRGRIELQSADGTVLEATEETWLCRCGQSKSKPYCDGNHALANFEDTTFSLAPGEPPVEPDAVLRIRARRDGPLKLDGPCEVQAPDGTVLMRGSETALCRCGQSGKRPFCDGTHRSIGFTG